MNDGAVGAERRDAAEAETSVVLLPTEFRMTNKIDTFDIKLTKQTE